MSKYSKEQLEILAASANEQKPVDSFAGPLGYSPSWIRLRLLEPGHLAAVIRPTDARLVTTAKFMALAIWRFNTANKKAATEEARERRAKLDKARKQMLKEEANAPATKQ